MNSIRARAKHVRAWLDSRKPDVLLLQELKGTEFPSAWFKELGYNSVSVTQKTCNGAAVLSRVPIETVSTTLLGDETDSHARFLEVIVSGTRIDHFLVSPQLSERIDSCEIDKTPRKQEKPSDHTPIVLRLK